MGEGAPRGPVAARVLDAEAARAALAEAAVGPGLDALLSRVSEIVLQRFGGDAAFAYVWRQGRRLFWAPAAGPLAGDVIFPQWAAWHDEDYGNINALYRSSITVDLAAMTRRTPTQESALAHGLRSSMRVALTDEQGEAIGFLIVGSLTPGSFAEPDLHELEAFAHALSWYVRPALLLEEQREERRLLEAEAAILGDIAECQDETELLDLVADRVRDTLRADLVLLLVEAGDRPRLIRGSPEDALDDELRAGALRAIATRGMNRAFHQQSRERGAFTNSDLQDHIETPLEAWMRDALGMRSAAVSMRSNTWGGLGFGVAALRRTASSWTEPDTGFLGRIARVMEISVERLRMNELAVEHAVQLENQAGMLATGTEILEVLSSTQDLGAACDTISDILREHFQADHVVFGLLDFTARTRTVLGFSSNVLRREEFTTFVTDADLDAYEGLHEGKAELLPDLRAYGPVHDAVETVRRRGLMSLMRAPFELSDGTTGTISIGSREPGRFAEVDVEALVELARPVGIAIDRVQLLARMAATSALLDAKTRVLAALVPGATIDSAGRVFVEETRKLFGAVHAVAALISRGQVRIAGIASDVIQAAPTRDHIQSQELNAPWRRVMNLGEPQLVADLGLLQRGDAEESLFAGGLRCIMRVPIINSTGDVLGMVTAGSPVADNWDETDLATFRELSQSLGLVFERALLIEAAQERSAKVEALTSLLGTLNPNSPPEEVARLFAARVREYLGADAFMVFAFDQESGRHLRFAVDGGTGAATSTTPDFLDPATYEGILTTPHAHFDATSPDAAPPWLRERAAALGYKSAVCVRLDASGEALGMMAAGSLAPGRLGPTELSILAAVAHPLGMILERARVVTNLRLQTQRTQAVLDILAALGPAETIEQLAGPIANALRIMYGADHCAIGAIEGDEVCIVAVDSNVTHWRIGDRAPLAALWGEDEPDGPVVHVIDDLEAAPATRGLSHAAREGGMRSSMRVLIGSRADPLGVVTVGSRQAARYSEPEARQLALIVQPLAVAVRYFRGKRDAELRTQRLEATNRILTRLSAGGTAEHLARGFLAECRTLFGTRHALAVQFDHDIQRGRLLAIDTDFPAAEALPRDFLLDEMHSARLVGQPHPHLINDVRREPNPNVRHLHLIDAGLYSVIRAPLVVHDTVRGGVSIWGEGAHRFTAEDAELLGTLTRPLALALEKASALESLGESELKYRSLVAQADEMIFLFEPSSLRLLDANTFTAQALGYEPADLNRLTLDRFMDATAEEITRNFAAAVNEGELHLSDARFKRADGSAFDVDIVASMVAYGGRQAVLVLARDVSERKALLRQLIQSQKMDSLGAMAGAVAHDFNNLLTTILGFAGLLKRSPNMDAEERENLGLIEDAARRAADLTGRLLSFSRGGLVRFGRVDLRTVVEDTLQLAEPTMHTGITVTRELPETSILVEGDAGQLQQALTNIVLNARDAMPEGGSIHVSVAIEGAVAAVRIADTGPGMDEETRVRIFEPFYTTKPVGSGTGLGMAITYGIIQGHHGDIAVASEPGQGTVFTISLPLLEYADETPEADAFNAGDGNLVLVVDDDAMVRRTTTATLAELGYNVVEAPGGSTAVEILRARPDRFSAVLLDLVMPGMTGSETFRALTAIRPDLPVVVCTGYAADSHIDTDVKRRIAGLVQKPFTAERLGRALAAAGAQPTRTPRI